jgi:hypothetical protein
MAAVTTARLVDGATGLEVLRFDQSLGVILNYLDIGYPELRTSTADRAGRDGVDDNTLYAGARAIIAALTLPDGSFYAVEDILRGVLHPSTRYWLYAQRDGWSTERRIQVVPRTYTPTSGWPKTAQIGWSAPEGMFEAPSLSGVTLSPAFTGGAAGVDVGGTAPTLAMVDFYGPCSNPSIRLAGRAQTLALATTVASGDFVHVDFDARTITTNNDAHLNRYTSLNFPLSSWWPLPAGPQTLAFNPATAGPGSVAVVTWRRRWI